MFSFFESKPKRVFLDHASTTPLDNDVFESMHPYFTEKFHNPSALYKEAVAVRNDIDKARADIAQLFDARSHQAVIYDGATEANNLTLQGIIDTFKKKNTGFIPHVIIGAIDHSSTLEYVQKRAQKGEIDYDVLNIGPDGDYMYQELKQMIHKNTVVVSINHANGEIGTVHDVRAVAKTIRKKRKEYSSVYPLLHVDSVQAFQYVDDMRLAYLGCDVCVISSSKIYGPKKVAAAVIRDTSLLQPVLYGGGQEGQLRPGTENTASIVGLACAAKKARARKNVLFQRLKKLISMLEKGVIKTIPGTIINSSSKEGLPHILNITLPEISHEEMVLRMDARGYMISAKSACKSDAEGDSHVIKALRSGNTESIRISLGKDTTKKECNAFLKTLTEEYIKMKKTNDKYAR